MRSQFYQESKRNRIKGRVKQILKDRIDTIQHMIDITDDKDAWIRLVERKAELVEQIRN